MTAYGRRGAVLASLAFAGTGGVSGRGLAAEPRCPETFVAPGVGNVSLVPTGWGVNAEVAKMSVLEDTIVAPMGSRSYFASYCTPGEYSNEQYQAWDLRGKTLVYTTDLSHAGCGCNAALYLVSMRQNKHKSECGDHYCDANNVCGESCTEIDIQEGNRFSWHSTLHASRDPGGMGKGYGGGSFGWSGPRDWNAVELGPGAKCVDTNLPFEVSAYFPVNEFGSLTAMEITLTQHGKDCPLWISVGGYERMAELNTAFANGMTPVVSYWGSDEMFWMDGKGADGKGPCQKELPDRCGQHVRFYNFSVSPALPPTAPPTPPTRSTTVAPRSSTPGGGGSMNARDFFCGAFAMLALQLGTVLLVWAVRSLTKRKDLAQPPCPAAAHPMMRVLGGSSQSLLNLATQEGPTGPPVPASREVSEVASLP